MSGSKEHYFRLLNKSLNKFDILVDSMPDSDVDLAFLQKEFGQKIFEMRNILNVHIYGESKLVKERKG